MLSHTRCKWRNELCCRNADRIQRAVMVRGGAATLRMRAEGKTFLFAPALRQADVTQMLEDKAWVDAEVAVLPNEVSEDVIARVTPETVILFVGKSAREKPSAEMMQVLEGIEVLRTDERGTVSLGLDKEQVQMLTER